MSEPTPLPQLLPQLLTEVYDRLLAAHGPQGWWPGDGPFETIVGAILTQNTAWANVDKAMANLRKAGVLSPQRMRELPDAELATLIRPSGYFNAKVLKLKAMLAYLARYADDFASWRAREAKELRAELLAVHGIGPETADDIVLYVAGLPSFVMDSYTQRLVDRLGIAPERRRYDDYQALFEDNLPPDASLYNEYHALLDAHAKAVCLKRAPRCDACVLRDLCPAIGTGNETS